LGLLCSRAEFRKVDYHLLLTFVMFFIFTGNISNLEVVQNLFERILNSSTNVFFTGLLVSQVISNVPATVLLSAFTEEAYLLDLLQGVNVGAMGTIIGSLASLITLKFVIKLYPERFKEYLIKYTVICLIYMAVIISVIFIL
jgi:Na+/H+ antiporter NhaD/arsenite permease-like protein